MSGHNLAGREGPAGANMAAGSTGTLGDAEVLRLEGLTVATDQGRTLVSGVDLTVRAGERLGLVGESGSGKTLTLRACLGILPAHVTWHAQRAVLCGEDLAGSTPRQHARLLGRSVGYVPQNADDFLHPLMKVSDQVSDGYLAAHKGVSKAQAHDRARSLLARMGIADPDRVMRAYPSQLSGGMRQRVNIACALMGSPSLVVADEPMAALDVVTAHEVVGVLLEACQAAGAALVLVSHSLDIVHACCDQLVVMHAGHMVERGPAASVYGHPGHPYTRALIEARPSVGAPRARRLREIGGTMPEAGRESAGCLFAGRCPLRDAACAGPVPWVWRDGHGVACAHAWAGEGPCGGGGDA